QPVLSGGSVTGTALAIFLIMVVVMMNDVKIQSFPPESHRERMLYADYASYYEIQNGPDRAFNGGMSARTAGKLYKDLEGAEAVSVYATWLQNASVSAPGKAAAKVDVRGCDADFFKVFDYTFIDGKPFTEADLESEICKAVITESVARKVFGRTDVVGEEIGLSMAPYVVSGVVKDVSILTTKAYADMWVPYTTFTQRQMWDSQPNGMMAAIILAKEGVKLTDVKKECDRLFVKFNEELATTGMQMIQRGRPYAQEQESVGVWSNEEPDVAPVRRQRMIILAILLLVPAINLSSMTQSRLHQRRAEIGVKRAFGASRARIISEIFAENIVVTLVAGLVGYLLSVGFALIYGSELFTSSSPKIMTSVSSVNLSVLIHVSTLMWALLFCLLLNVISTGIPVWQAARVNVVNAIKG
ncbi:MAG: ABC transporter permease, partial [Muribaculaceae bacterium]|nr:ABC transporter permease [Muribaculaceae bacterium]